MPPAHLLTTVRYPVVLLSLALHGAGVCAADSQATDVPTNGNTSHRADGRADYLYGPAAQVQSCDQDFAYAITNTNTSGAALRSESINEVDVATPLGSVSVNDNNGDDLFLNPPAIADTIDFQPLTTHIVSPGQPVSFHVSPRDPNGKALTVTVDRMPGNAQFLENHDGSRTFVWQTGIADEGEHLFRFTAVHPDDTEFVATRDAMIIIGDPSSGGSQPVDTPPHILNGVNAPEW